MGTRFTIKKKKTVEEEPAALKEFIEFLEEQEHRLSQAAYELEGEAEIHLESIEESSLSDEDKEAIRRLVEEAGLDRAECEVQGILGNVQDLLRSLQGE